MEKAKKPGIIVRLGDYIVNTIDGREPVAIDKTKYCLTVLFLGWLGVHQFMAGKRYMGIFYLATCWCGLSLALSVTDLVVGLCKQKDENDQILV